MGQTIVSWFECLRWRHADISRRSKSVYFYAASPAPRETSLRYTAPSLPPSRQPFLHNVLRGIKHRNSGTGSAVLPAPTSPISRVKIETHPAPTLPISRVKSESHPTISPARTSLVIPAVHMVGCVNTHQGTDKTMQEGPGTRLPKGLSAEPPIAHWRTNSPVDAQLTTPLLPSTPSHAPDTHTQQGNDPNPQRELPQELTLVPINLPRGQRRNAASRSKHDVAPPSTHPVLVSTSCSNKWPIPPPATPLILSTSFPTRGIAADVDKPNDLDTNERRQLQGLRGQDIRGQETIRKLKRRVLDLEQEAATMRKVHARKASTLQWLVHHPERALEIWTDVRRKFAVPSRLGEEGTVETEPVPRKRLRMEAVVIHVRPRTAAESTGFDGGEC